MPCPCCNTSGFKSYHFHVYAGALGVFLSSISGVQPKQREAFEDIFNLLGMERAKVVTPNTRARKFRHAVETHVRCEMRFPLYDSTIVAHIDLHFFEDGGWAELVGPAPPLQK